MYICVYIYIVKKTFKEKDSVWHNQTWMFESFSFVVEKNHSPICVDLHKLISLKLKKKKEQNIFRFKYNNSFSGGQYMQKQKFVKF